MRDSEIRASDEPGPVQMVTDPAFGGHGICVFGETGRRPPGRSPGREGLGLGGQDEDGAGVVEDRQGVGGDLDGFRVGQHRS